MKLKILFAAVVIAQSFLTLNLKAEESPAIDLSHILACEDCGGRK